MPNKSWKNIERKVADMLGGKRVPSSGSGAIKGDVQHDDFYIEFVGNIYENPELLKEGKK